MKTFLKIIEFIGGFLTTVFLLRFALKIFGASNQKAFALWVYKFTTPLLKPFEGTLPDIPIKKTAILELDTLVAALVVFFVWWGVNTFASIFAKKKKPVEKVVEKVIIEKEVEKEPQVAPPTPVLTPEPVSATPEPVLTPQAPKDSLDPSTEHLSIMFTDIKGFTSKTSAKSRQELHEFLELHEKLIVPIFYKFNGNIVKTIGDAFLVTFKSPTDAVLCGIKIQEVLKKHNQKFFKKEDIEVRVAINSGEVTLRDNDVFGEPVNIAARIEAIAEANEIYFTEAVYLTMNKSEIPTAEVGYRRLKGIPQEIKVYKVISETA